MRTGLFPTEIFWYTAKAVSRRVSWCVGRKIKTTSVIVTSLSCASGAVQPSSIAWNCGLFHGSAHPRNVAAIRTEVQLSWLCLPRSALTALNCTRMVQGNNFKTKWDRSYLKFALAQDALNPHDLLMDPPTTNTCKFVGFL